MLANGHHLRDLGEYEGDVTIDERIVPDLIEARGKVAESVVKLPLRGEQSAGLLAS